jgi:PAS domain S-box-containing protein
MKSDNNPIHESAPASERLSLCSLINTQFDSSNNFLAEQICLQILNNSREGVIVYGHDLKYLVWNPFMEQLTGISSSEALGRHPLELFPFLQEAGVMDALEKALSGEAPAPLDFPFFNVKNGRKVWASDVTSPLRNSHHKVIGVIGTVRDITERKLLEDTQIFLAQYGWTGEGEDFFEALARYLAESLDLDYVCIDQVSEDCNTAKTVAIYFDGTFEDNVEYTLKETPCGDVVGKTICSFPENVRYLFPKDATLQEMIAESYVGTTLCNSEGKTIGLIALIGRKKLKNFALAETILKLVSIRAAGEMERRQTENALHEAKILLEQRVMERTAELSDANIILRKEISDRERLELQLFRAKKMEAIGQIAGGVAHEVRNPLNAILTITEALFREKEIESNPEYDPFIQHIRTQVTRLVHLMNDLLDLGRNIPATNFQPITLYELCRETLDLWKSSGMSKNRRGILTSDCDNIHFKVMADALKLQQIFFNLLENAGHHTKDGSGVTIRLMQNTSTPPDNMAVVHITDQGSGIPEDKLIRVFEPFYTDRKGGTGLGLALVRHFIESMGGTVQIWNNNPPPGCTVEVRIPLYLEESK